MIPSRRTRKRAKRWLVFQFARFIAGVIGLMPIGMALALGRAFGRCVGALDSNGRRRAIRQLVERLGAEPQQAKSIAAAVYRNVGMVAVEIALLPRLLKQLTTYVDLPDADRAVLRSAADEGRGVIFVTGHVGNWELLAQRVVYDGFDGVTLARRSPNPFLGEWIVQRRMLGGLQTINRGEPRAARNMLSAMKRGALLGVLLDQDTNVPSVHVPFFGLPASTPMAAAELALRRGAPIVVGFIERKTETAGHRVRLERVDVVAEGSRAEQVQSVTAALSLKIEEAVRRSPGEWVWFHERWRS